MNLICRRACALLAVAVLSPLLLGCGGDDEGDESTTAPTPAPAPASLEAIHDALAVSGFEVTSATVGEEEVPVLLIEGDESVLLFDDSFVADLDADALSELTSEVLGEGETSEETCVKYRIVGPGGEFQDSVVDLVCG